MPSILERLKSDEVVFLDGAVGTEIQRRGAPIYHEERCRRLSRRRKGRMTACRAGIAHRRRQATWGSKAETMSWWSASWQGDRSGVGAVGLPQARTAVRCSASHELSDIGLRGGCSNRCYSSMNEAEFKVLAYGGGEWMQFPEIAFTIAPLRHDCGGEFFSRRSTAPAHVEKKEKQPHVLPAVCS